MRRILLIAFALLACPTVDVGCPGGICDGKAYAASSPHVHHYNESRHSWGWCGLKQVRRMCCSCGDCCTPCDGKCE